MRDLQAFEIQAVNGGNSGVSFTAAMLLTPVCDNILQVTAITTALGLVCAAPLVAISGNWIKSAAANAGAVLLGSIAGQYFASLIAQPQSDSQSQ